MTRKGYFSLAPTGHIVPMGGSVLPEPDVRRRGAQWRENWLRPTRVVRSRTGGEHKVTTATLWLPAVILGILMLVFLIYYVSS